MEPYYQGRESHQASIEREASVKPWDEEVKKVSDFHKAQMDMITQGIFGDLSPRPYTKSKDRFLDQEMKRDLEVDSEDEDWKIN